MTKAKKKDIMEDDQYQPLLSDGFESIGIFKDYIQGDRYGGIYDIGMPLVVSFDTVAFDVTLHRTVDMEAFIADPSNYNYMRRVESFINKLIQTWKKFGPGLTYKKEVNTIKWTGKSLTLEDLTEVALQLQTVWEDEAGTKQPVIDERMWAWTFAGIPKITKKINLKGINGYLTFPETVRKNRLTVVASTRQAVTPWAEFLCAYGQTNFLPQIFDLHQHNYAQYIHKAGETDYILGLVRVFLSKLTQGIQIAETIDIDALLFYNLNNIAAFSLTQVLMDGKPAVNRENLFVPARFMLTLNVEDFMTDKNILVRRSTNANLGHYPNAFDTGSRIEYLLPIGASTAYVKMTKFINTMEPIDSEFLQCTPVGGYEDSGVPFQVQDAEFNKQIGLIRELSRDFRIIRPKTVNPFNVLLRPPDNKYGVPIKFWPVYFYLPKVTFVFYQFVGEIPAWYSNIYSIYNGNLFKLDEDQFKTKNFAAVKVTKDQQPIEATLMQQPVNFSFPVISRITGANINDQVPEEYRDVYTALFSGTTSTESAGGTLESKEE